MGSSVSSAVKPVLRNLYVSAGAASRRASGNASDEVVRTRLTTHSKKGADFGFAEIAF